jgi:hypothetical protein
MGERYIKDGIMYEKNDSFLSLGGDHRLGTVTEASMFDVNINSSHVFTPDAFGAPREEVNAEGTLVLPLRTESYVVTDNDGDSTTFRHDSWQGVYAEEGNKDSSRQQTESSGGFSSGSGPNPSRGYAGGAGGKGSATPSQRRVLQSRHNTVTAKKPAPRRSDGTGAVLVGALVLLGLLALSHSASRQREEMADTRPQLPPMPTSNFNALLLFCATAVLGLVGVVFGVSHPHDSLLANQLHFAIANTLLYPSLVPLIALFMVERLRRKFFRIYVLYNTQFSPDEFNAVFRKILREL